MKDNLLDEKAFHPTPTERELIREHRATTPVMDQKEIDKLKEIIDGDHRVLAEECRKLISSLEIAREDAGELIMELEIAKALRKTAYREVVRLQGIRRNLRGCVHLIWIKLKTLFLR